ncbi:MAG: glycosyltransferase family 1 protein [Solirubrobacterales bacterium]|nr:glycosyltransferase family 1 protein [Solirubrobacterales bacterium]
MDVTFLNPVYWPEVRRGSERVIRELADGLVAAGHRPRLITSHPSRPTTTLEDGLTVQRVWRPPLEQRLRRRLYEEHLAHVPFTYAALRRGQRPDVVQAAYATDAAAALRYKRATGVPVVFSYMGLPHRVSLANRRLRKELVVAACEQSDAVVALSELAAEHFRTWLGVDPHVIGAPVDVQAFTPAADPAAARSPAPTILCAADHTQGRKRVALLVQALAIVRRTHPEAQLLLSRVAGAGAMGARVNWAAVDGVTEIDLDDRDRLVTANRAAWVHALPSTGEAFGLVLAEAQACGTPVVGAQAEVVGAQDGTGVLFPSTEQDPAVLADALLAAIELAQDPATVRACVARAQRFSRQACTDAHLALYRSLGADA